MNRAAVDALLREAAKPLNADRARRTQNPSRKPTRRLVAVPPLPAHCEVDGQDGGAT